MIFPGKIAYVGATRNYENRKSLHLSSVKKLRHSNPKVTYYFLKFGSESIEWKVLKTCYYTNPQEQRDWLSEQEIPAAQEIEREGYTVISLPGGYPKTPTKYSPGNTSGPVRRITAGQIAERYGMTPRNVRLLANKLGIGKTGRDYLFTVRDEVKIKRAIPTGMKRGRKPVGIVREIGDGT